ncbi:beta-lactamase family protein [Trichothermofontia sichuanensis B231]|uniref:serine hydrolase domain-containing protein n=1 Tax=Trichothermofontia sichuanensis TaxID=3045816 RepID=UPI0022481FA8|nr:serine hydrolase domain-containing protein [Trichothermofontia sichuanensis]UZQ54859.1 beta-lactamase family protein [Trichothermofontia sichuanensis B231]
MSSWRAPIGLLGWVARRLAQPTQTQRDRALGLAWLAGVSLSGLGGCQIRAPVITPPVIRYEYDCRPAAPPLAVSPELTSQRQQQLQAHLDRYLIEHNLPGGLLWIRTPRSVWVGTAGVQDLTTQKPLQASDRFRIGSITKLWVAVVVLQLVQEGHLGLDDRLEHWLPADLIQSLPQGDRLTVRQLLSHTSGLADVRDSPAFEAQLQAQPQHIWTLGEMLAYAVAQPPQTHPGEFHYANTNYLLLQKLIEVRTGQPLAIALRERLFTPLGLEDTALETTPQPNLLVSGYGNWDGDNILDNFSHINEAYGFGDSGLVSTAADLDRFAQALWVQNCLLSPNLQALMAQPQSRTLDHTSRPIGYGLGVTTWETPWGRAIGHGGRFGGFVTLMLHISNYQLTMIVMLNNENGDPRELADIIQTLLFSGI